MFFWWLFYQMNKKFHLLTKSSGSISSGYELNHRLNKIDATLLTFTFLAGRKQQISENNHTASRQENSWQVG